MPADSRSELGQAPPRDRAAESGAPTVLDFAAAAKAPVTAFDSRGVAAVQMARGTGESHVYALDFGAGSVIGFHPAGFDQLFLVVSGSGWVEIESQGRRPVAAGCAAVIRKGQVHAKGSEPGMRVLMLQAEAYEVPPRPAAAA